MLGKQLSQYMMTEKLGERGMREVFFAEDTKLKLPRAMATSLWRCTPAAVLLETG